MSSGRVMWWFSSVKSVTGFLVDWSWGTRCFLFGGVLCFDLFYCFSLFYCSG